MTWTDTYHARWPILWRTTLKSLYWTLLVALFGLLQLWLVLGYQVLTDQGLRFDTIARDGALLFFAAAVTIGLTLDYWFEPPMPMPGRLWTATAFVFYPLLIMILVVATAMALAIDAARLSASTLVGLTWIISAMTAIYAILVKSLMFYARAGGPTDDNGGRLRS